MQRDIQISRIAATVWLSCSKFKRHKAHVFLRAFVPLCFIWKRCGEATSFIYACEIATATDTEAPTIGLLPIPINPIIST
jgi:hypothetical protein